MVQQQDSINHDIQGIKQEDKQLQQQQQQQYDYDNDSSTTNQTF